jgi:large subunit ribosomal protein L22
VAATETQHEVRAVAKWVRMSPRKARLVTEHIRGRSVPEARTVLAFTQRAAAREVEKVLRSAVANAEANHGLLGDSLVVSAAYVDEGPVMKRWRARARGRVARIKKPTCHITVKLAPGPETARIAPPPAPEPEPAPEETPPTEPAAETETAEQKPKPKPRAARKPSAEATEKPKRTRTRKEAPKKPKTSSDES